MDFRINDQGSIVGFTPVSGPAREFLEDQVDFEAWQQLGSTVWVEHCAAQDLVDTLQAEGFVLA